MRIGVGLSLPGVAVRQRLIVTITNIVIEGDSITSAFPDENSSTQPGDASGSYGYRYRAHRPDKTIRIRAQGSRVTLRTGGYDGSGNPVYFTDVTTLPVDHGTISSPSQTNNSLGSNVTEDISYGPQLITYMIGTNDLAGIADGPYTTDLKALFQRYKAKNPAVLVAWSAPVALNYDTRAGFYDGFMASRASLLSTCRNPAVWSQWCDYYLPMGQQPDLGLAGNGSIYFGGDPVHPNAAGQVKMYASYEAAMDSLLDASRVSSTEMYAQAWPADAAGLDAGQTYRLRFIVSGLAHKGIALTGSNVLSASGATLSLNGDAPSASKTGWLYNGDAVDVVVVAAAAGQTKSVTINVGTGSKTVNATSAVASPYTAKYDSAKKSQYAEIGDNGYSFRGVDAGDQFPTTAGGDTALSTPTGYVEFTYQKSSHAYAYGCVGVVNSAYTYPTATNLAGGGQSNRAAFDSRGAFAGTGGLVTAPGFGAETVGIFIHKASGKMWLRNSAGWFPDTPVVNPDGTLGGSSGAGFASGLIEFFFAAGSSDDSKLFANPGKTPFTYAPPANGEPGWR